MEDPLVNLNIFSGWCRCLEEKLKIISAGTMKKVFEQMMRILVHTWAELFFRSGIFARKRESER
jgi:hypothetical protein